MTRQTFESVNYRVVIQFGAYQIESKLFTSLDDVRAITEKARKAQLSVSVERIKTITETVNV